MAELIIDFEATPSGTFRGDRRLPAPVVFLRAHNNEHAPVVTSGPLAPLMPSEPTDFGTVTRIEDLAAVHDGALMLHAPGRGGFQTVQQAFGLLHCPHMHMEIETHANIDRHTERKWLAWWLIPEDEYLAIGGDLSTAGDPDFMEVVKNRLPRTPRNSIMWRPQGSPVGGGTKAWLVQFTGTDQLPDRRNLPWEPISKHGSLNHQRIEIDGRNFQLQARRVDGSWEKVLDTSEDERLRDIVPVDWLEKRIVFLLEAADYESWDPSKGDGAGPATRHISRVRLRAPQVWTMRDAAVGPVEPEPAEPEPPEPAEVDPEPTEPEPTEPEVNEPQPTEPDTVSPATPAQLRALADLLEERWAADVPTS